MLKQDEKYTLSIIQAKACNDILDRIESENLQKLTKETVNNIKEKLNKVK